ncbi:MAG: 16S rRNA (guanine(966)-N(2))-methyltransferase RsmD [Solirubrobacteraceae bacterium MAG38_C4-C5]|nr:16S rRNA (guanine(966)-N(2))-methyltransferase RsmD [Candidatus Siliceabacter maunaloa]
MRIVAGTHRGRGLVAPAGRDTRPTSDRVREALFSILEARAGKAGGAQGAPFLTGARVLDLFAGSGALGLEALSRGAASAVFVDSARPAVEAVRANLAALRLDAPVHCRDAPAALRDAAVRGDAYDLVFLDPPYRPAVGLAAQLREALPAVLAPRARVVAESDRRTPLAIGLAVSDERRYGETLIRIHDT